ncbi:MAG: hypothetical protein M1503_03125 [Thaumarchaeota archaeon]|nr:hypothetical protein [Nitrososphaerota archaeon]MCL5317244.1 hypothetical protein [Nitrososphaerota archaeon]
MVSLGFIGRNWEKNWEKPRQWEKLGVPEMWIGRRLLGEFWEKQEHWEKISESGIVLGEELGEKDVVSRWR